MDTATLSKSVGLIEFNDPMYNKADDEDWAYSQVYQGDAKVVGGQIPMYDWAGPGAPEELAENAAVPFSSFIELPAQYFTAVWLALGFWVSERLEMFNNKIPQLMNRMADGIGTNHSQAKGYYHALPFIRGWSSSYPVPAGDSAALFSTHTTRAGNSVLNNLTAQTMSYEAVVNMIIHLESGIYTEDGQFWSDEPWGLMFHPSNFEKAHQILKNFNEPDSANRNENVVAKQYSIKPIPCRRLTPTSAYVLIGKRAAKRMISKTVKDLAVDWDWHFLRRAHMCTTVQSFIYAIADWRGLVANYGQ